MNQKSFYQQYGKRLLDIVFSFIALLILSPVILIMGILVRVKLGSPIVFTQKRPGLNEEIFVMYKFRTMTNEYDDKGSLLPDSNRLTPFGRMLRSTSLDELPELWNIFKGDMSMVGPRPLATEYLPYYKDEERIRHSVRPGLSGLAQINGRNTTNWDERFIQDINYVNKITFTSDLAIIIKTILKVIHRSDIGERGVDSLIDFDIYRQEKSKGGETIESKR